jgi:hypothetical protein
VVVGACYRGCYGHSKDFKIKFEITVFEINVFEVKPSYHFDDCSNWLKIDAHYKIGKK